MLSRNMAIDAELAKVYPPRSWPQILDEIMHRVIDASAVGVCLLTVNKGLLGRRVSLRANMAFKGGPLVRALRRHFTVARFDGICERRSGWPYRLEYGGYEVVMNRMGLGVPEPVRGCMLMRVTGSHGEHALLVFAYVPAPQQIRSELAALEGVLCEMGSGSLPGPAAGDNAEQDHLMAEFRAINVKRLYTYELGDLARIVNGLDHRRHELPRSLRPKFKKITDYVLKKQMSDRRMLRKPSLWPWAGAS